MFGGFLGGDFPDDQFFGNQIQHINRMMDPFQMMAPFGGMGMGRSFPMDPYSMMNNFKQQMESGNCTSFFSSSVMTMTSGPDGRPQIYQESSSTRTAPGGVKETKKSVCDSQSGTKRLAIGRHIGERGHVKERMQNMRSGEREDTEDFINIEEDEAEGFNREWTQKTRSLGSRPQTSLHIGYHDNEDEYSRPRAIMPSASSTSAADHGPIIEEVDDDEGVVVEKTRKRQRERAVPEITEVLDHHTDSTVPRKIKQRSRKFLQKLIPK